MRPGIDRLREPIAVRLKWNRTENKLESQTILELLQGCGGDSASRYHREWLFRNGIRRHGAGMLRRSLPFRSRERFVRSANHVHDSVSRHTALRPITRTGPDFTRRGVGTLHFVRY